MHPAAAAAIASLAALLPAATEPEAPGRDLLALQAAVERAVARGEKSIACVLVSRSKDYAPPPGDVPGRLGGYEPPRGFVQPDEAGRDLDLSRTDRVPESYGSGIVIDRTGLVLTCAHVIQNATKLYVRLPGGKGSYADIQASDPRSDLAVLRLIDPPTGLTPAVFGDGAKLRKGQFVVGLANPYAAGFRDGSASASWGLVSNLRRRAPGKLLSEADRALQSFHRYGTLVQTDVRLGQGCSGGALLDLEGQVVAVTTALAALDGVDAPGGFAVPVDARTRQVIDVLARGEEVEYGFLGVLLEPDSRGGRGVFIRDVVPNSPAAAAGLERGDTLVAINGVPVRENNDLFLQVGSLTAGSEVRLEVERPGSITPRALAPARLTKLYVSTPPLASHRPAARGGLRVDYSSVLMQRSGPQPIPEAVVIREVVPNSPAANVPLLQPDRLIARVNGTPVRTPAEFYREMDHSPGRAELTVITGNGQQETVSLDTR